MTVASILRDKGNTIISVHPETPLMELVATIASRRIGAVLVLDGAGDLAGIVSERDVVKALASRGPELHKVNAGDVMTSNVTTVTPATTINEAMELMDHGYFRHLPVLDDGALVGIVSVRDVVRARIDHHVEENQTLVSYINTRV
ncbi:MULTISPECIES: CBS domain-containing protein [Sphingosinicellaceae]|uniref:CBS domain-containing protein n=1 Tax=Sphingosinicellaceae TaxID=2820280 RepID=UPI001C1E2C2E|nr:MULTISPECIES: CBS domain-containing protein [Polymorphobacter]QYE36634.1 CBS domain-containing protein [Polymorphobacter sp. PAMC 29334]UAJ08763.1 CBS domain-containing protein [Polymorphobacter megasporae]